MIIGKKEYPYINEYPKINLPGNVFWVIPDYPFDVGPNLSVGECIKKRRDNIKKWGHLKNSIAKKGG
jgi:hypothetical protein